MNGDPQKRKVLYDALTKDGYALGTLDEFSAKMDNPEKVRALYDGVTKDGYQLGDFETFNAKVGPSFQQPLRPMTTPASGADGGGLPGGSATSLGPSGAPGSMPGPDGVPDTPSGATPDGRAFTDDYFDTPFTGPAQGPPTLAAPPTNRFANRVQEIERVEAKSAASNISRASRDAGVPRGPVFLQYKNVQFDPTMQAMDPREARIQDDFEVFGERAGLRKTQFSNKERRERIEQGAWTPQQEASYRGDMLSFQAQILRGRAEKLKDLVEQGADPQTLQAEAQDIDAGREYVLAQAEKLVLQDPKSVAEKLRERAQAISDADNSTGGDLARSFVFSANNTMRSTLAGAARLLDFGEGYTTADKLSEWAAGIEEDRDALIGTKTKESIAGKLASGGGTMLALLTMGNTGGAISKLATGAVSTAASAATTAGSALASEYEGYVQQAMRDGATKQQAEAGASVYAPISAAIEFVNPQLYLANKAGISTMRKGVMEAVRNGVKPKVALREAMNVADKGVKEALEEVAQTATERATNYASNQLAGTELNTEISAQEIGETALVSFILGGLAEGGQRYATRKERSRAAAEALKMAAENPAKAAELIDKYAPKEQQEAAKERVADLARTYNGNGLRDMDPEAAANVADVIDRKNEVERAIKEAPMDATLEAINGDPRKQQSIALTLEAMESMGIEPKKAVLALAGQGMLDVPEGAKVKKSANGTVDIEVKEAKEGETALTKDEVLNDLLEQVKAIAPKQQNDDAITIQDAEVPPDTEVPVASAEVEAGPLASEEVTATEGPTPVGEGAGAVTPIPSTQKPIDEGEQSTTEAPAAQAPEGAGPAAGVPATPEPEAAAPVRKDLTEDLPDDPKALADAYFEDHQVWNSDANPEYAMINAMKGRVKESSYDEWGDPNDKGNQMARTYFAKKGAKAWGLDQIAEELTETLGREVAPDQLAELMRANQSGLPRTSPRMRQTAERYQAMTGKRLTSAQGARSLKQKGKSAVKEQDAKDFIDQHTDQDGNVNWQGVKDNVHALGFLGYTDEQARNIEAEADRQLAANAGGGEVLEPVRAPEEDAGRGGEQERSDAEEAVGRQARINEAKAHGDAKRTRPRHAIEFEKPIEGPSGAKLIGYVWQYQWEEYVDQRGEDRIRRVSNWDEAELSDETGRDIVHQFSVQDKDGAFHLVSAEGALRMMGYLGQDGKDARSKMSAAKTLASLMMQRDALRNEVAQYEKAKKDVDVMVRPPIEVIDQTDEETKANEIRYGRQEWKMGDAVVWVSFNKRDGLREEDRLERTNTLIQSWKNERLKEMGVSPYLNPSTKLRDVEKKIAVKERQLDARASTPEDVPDIPDEELPISQPRTAEAAARKAAAVLERAKLRKDRLYALPIPPNVWNGAITALQDVIVAGGKAVDAIAAAIKHVQESDWWKSATKQEQDEVTSHLNDRLEDLEEAIEAVENEVPPVMDADERVTSTAARFVEHGTSKKAARAYMEQKGVPEESIKAVLDAMTQARAKVKEGKATTKAVEEGTVKREPRKVTVNEMAALKDQIRAEAHSSKETAKSIAEARKDFAARVEELVTGMKGAFTANQTAQIVKGATRVDPTNPKQVARYLNSLSTRMDRAAYDQEVSDAETLRDRALKFSKNQRVPWEMREVLRAAAAIDPGLLSDPSSYVDAVGTFLTNLAPVTSDRFADQAGMTIAELDKYIRGWEKEQEKAYDDMLADEFGIRSEGIDAQELYEALQDGTIDRFMSGRTDEQRAAIEARVADMLQQRLDALARMAADPKEDLTDADRRDLKAIAKADISLLNLEQQGRMILVTQNMLLNGGIGGINYAKALAEASAGVTKGMELAAKSPVRKLFGVAVKGHTAYAATPGFSMSDAMSFFFGQGKLLGQIQNIIGLGDYVRGKTAYVGEVKDIAKGLETFFADNKRNNPTADTAASVVAEGVVGYAIQAMPGLDAKAAFEVNKAHIREDIRRKMGTRSGHAQALLAQQVYDEVLDKSNTREEAMAALKAKYPGAHATIQQFIDLNAKFRDRVQQHSIRTWNMSGQYGDPFYLPKSTFSSADGWNTLEPSQMQGMRQKGMMPQQAGSTLARQRVMKLPKDRLINYGLRSAAFYKLTDTLLGVHTDDARIRMNNFLGTPAADPVFGNAENREFVRSRVKDMIGVDDPDPHKADPGMLMADRVVNYMRGVAVKQALGGFTQATRQVPEALTQAMILLGRDMHRMYGYMPDVVRPGSVEGAAAKDLMEKYAVGHRGHAEGGSAWEGDIHKLTSAYYNAVASGLRRKALEIQGKIGKVFMLSLTKGDVLSARSAWLAFYAKERARQGHGVRSWVQEAQEHDSDESRQDAAMYAEAMVDRMMSSSDVSKMAGISKRGKPGAFWENLAKASILAFTGTSIQQMSRRASDAATLGSWAVKRLKGEDLSNAEAYDPGRLLLSLLAGAAGSAVFLGARIYIAQALRDQMAELYRDVFGDDDDDEGTIPDRMKLMTNLISVLYLLGMMDADVFRAVDKATTDEEKNRDPKPPDEVAIRRRKMLMTQFASEMLGTSIVQPAENAAIEAVNGMFYLKALQENDPSALTKAGNPLGYGKWAQDPANPPLFKYGKFIDREHIFGNVDAEGAVGVFLKNALIIEKMIDRGDDQEKEYGTPEQKELRRQKAEKKKRMKAMDGIAEQVASGDMTWDQAMSTARKQLAAEGVKEAKTNDPQAPYMNHLKHRIRYDRAPQWVKEVLDESSLYMRVSLARKKLNSLTGEERVKEKAALKAAGVWTDGFDAEWARTK